MEEKEFNMIFERWRTPLVRYCNVHIFGNTNLIFAEEAVQEAFIKVLKNYHRYDPSRGAFSTWLYSIAKNECLQLLRREDRYVRHDMIIRHGNDIDEYTASPNRRYVGNDTGMHPATKAWLIKEYSDESESKSVLLKRVSRIVDEKLAKDHREILLESLDKSFTYEKLAKKYDLSLNTIKSRIKQSKDRIRVEYMIRHKNFQRTNMNQRAAELAKEYGRDRGTIFNSLARGWSEEKIKLKYG